MNDPQPTREGAEALLARLAPVLAAPDASACLQRAAELGAALADTKRAALFLLEGGDVALEAWFPPREQLPPGARASLRRAARECELRDPNVVERDENAVVLAVPVRLCDRVIGAWCGLVAETADLEAIRRVLEPTLALAAPRFAAWQEAGRTAALRGQYERWFRTLDEQVRVLDRERQKFAAMVHQSDAAVFVADPDGRVTWTNSVLAAVAPRDGRGSWVGAGCGEILARFGGGSSDRQESMRKALDRGEVTHEELRRTDESGVRDHYLTVIPIRGPDGRPQELMVMIQDITNLEVLRRAEERLRTVVSNAPIVMFAIDPQGVFTMSEGRGLEALGLRPGEVVGRSALEMYAEVPAIVDYITRALAGEALTEIVELGPLAYETRYTPMRDDAGRVTGMIGVATDFSDRKRLEEQLRQSQKMEAIGRLAGGVAHDFNNLLAAILGHTELMLARVAPGDSLYDHAEQIQKAGVRGALLTRQLLSFSRKQVIAPEVLDLNLVVAEMDELLCRLIGEDIELVTKFAADPAKTRVDRGQLEQIVMNLAVNARDALPGGGQLTLEVETVELDDEYARTHTGVLPGSYVLLSVSDNGCGMDQETVAHAFEPFYTTKAEGKGTGLGLSTVYAIVEQAGGHIWLYSEPGLGTSFKVYLPRVYETAVAPVPAKPAARNLNGTETILLVEDEDAVRSLAREALEARGYRIIEASHGADAIWQMQNTPRPIDLLVTDVVMPQMGGGELAQRLRSVQPKLPVIFMSGYPDDAVVRQGVLEEGAPFVQKPFTLESLARKVRDVLDRAA